jgi:hypothetical protein
LSAGQLNHAGGRDGAPDAASVVVGIPLDDPLEVVLAGGAVLQLVGGALIWVHRAELQAGVRVAAARERIVGLTVAVDVVIEQLAHVVRDHVEDHEHPLLVRRIDELAQLLEVAEMLVRAQEVLGPVAVIAVEPRVVLDVLHDRRDPQRGDAEVLEVIEVVDHALPVATVKLARHRGLDAHVVVRVTIGEPVDHDLVDDLVAPVDVGVALVRQVDRVFEIRCAPAGGAAKANPEAEPEGEQQCSDRHRGP